MSQQIINVGAAANDGTGDPHRTAFIKSKENFAELYPLVGTAASLVEAETGTEPAIRSLSPLRVHQAANAAIADAEDWIVAEKTILESRSVAGVAQPSGSGVPLDDAELQLTVEAGAKYRIAGEFLVIYTFGEVGGFKANILVPVVEKLTLFVNDKITTGLSGPSQTQTYNVKHEIASGGTAFADGALGLAEAGAGVIGITTWRGFLDQGVAGGLFKFKWSNWTPGGGAAAILYPGSWIGLKKVS